ncbi:Hemolysin-type calcium-binding repeat-containing protein [Thalassovita gelatinovora]|uniref:DVUA0089 family protein n=1 Tax=Thalassovita gelatinovora TaxID=53501 RepID=UPI0008D8144A|nr:DVUA0089 family protein [Thalassovita gelatinovora]QIZ82700.1 cadherin-like domain-containing protein [Thalassovita gelatinovora]SER10594.1 Hemolysin-type calcium-binding repeat-containing protein [Thalassovita gelatinovora]
MTDAHFPAAAATDNHAPLAADDRIGGQTGSNTVIETEANNGLATAQPLDGLFAVVENPDIAESATRASVSIIGSGDDTADYFAFTVPVSGVTMRFDIDYGMESGGSFDPYLHLWDSAGTRIDRNDDSYPVDPGSVHPYDSDLSYDFTEAGRYTISVGRYPGSSDPDNPVPSGGTYQLQITTTQPYAGRLTDAVTPVSIAAADLLENDSDPDGDALSITSVSASSALGAALLLTADGSIRYDPTGVAAIAALAESDRQEDSFSYTVSDGFGGSAEATVTVIVSGEDLAPELTGSQEDIAGYHGDDFSYQIAADLFRDPTDFQIRYDLMLSDGSALPAWLHWDATTRVISYADADVDAAQVGSYGLRLSATETDGQSSSLLFRLLIEDGQDLTGTPGDDTLSGGTGPDTISGLEGNDSLDGLERDDFLEGLNGADLIAGGGGDDTIEGGGQNDTITGDDGNDLIGAGLGDDSVSGGDGTDQIVGGGGDDLIQGEAGEDQLYGMTGNDSITGGIGNDTIGGGDGDDSLQGNENHDMIGGGTGNDTLIGDDSNDEYGRDSLFGGAGQDDLFGAGSADRLYGDEGDDLLRGGYGGDLLHGGAGDDFLFGGYGRDTLTGGDGADRFYLSGEDGDSAVITDYDAGEGDVILLNGDLIDRSSLQLSYQISGILDAENTVSDSFISLILYGDGRNLANFDGLDGSDRIVVYLDTTVEDVISRETITFDLADLLV